MKQSVVRSSVSGRFVKKSRAKSSPKTTVTETVTIKNKKSKKVAAIKKKK
jgi:hypothetical protein